MIVNPEKNNFMIQYDAAKNCFNHVAVYKGNLVNGRWPIRGDLIINLQATIKRIHLQFAELNKCAYQQGNNKESDVFKEYGLRGYLLPHELLNFLEGIKIRK